MSLQRKINRRLPLRRDRYVETYGGNINDRHSVAVEDRSTAIMSDKGLANGSCNRRDCQAPLAEEPEHQFMDGNFTGGPRLHYCERCAKLFDRDDRQFGDPIRIKREWKVQVA